MSRRVYLLGVGIALLAVALALTDWALSLQPGVTAANVRHLRPGMLLDEVEATLGLPSSGRGKAVRNGWQQLRHQVARRAGRPGGNRLGCLVPGDGGAAYLIWGSDARLLWAEWKPDTKANLPGFLARLRAWLGW